MIAEVGPVDGADWEAWTPLNDPDYRRLPATGRVRGLGARVRAALEASAAGAACNG